MSDAYAATEHDEKSPERAEHDEALADFIAKFKESAETRRPARVKAQRDRDYVDNKQLTEDELKALEKRGQPAVTFNLVRGRVNYFLGLEKQQRRDPKALGRNPIDDDAAEVATDGMKYACDAAQYFTHRSAAWKTLCVEGEGALEFTISKTKRGTPRIGIGAIPWDRFFVDPHSVRPDYLDANYIGQVLWMDEADAMDRWPNGADAIKLAYSCEGASDTYTDTPDWEVWSDPKRKRVRVVQMYFRQRGEWMFAEFTSGGILDYGPSPFHNDEDESVPGILAESCYMDREGNRYGAVRDLIDPQDEVNKRRSKALHLLNVNSVIADKGAVDNKEAARREANRPDGFIEKNPGSDFEIHRNSELASGQVQLLVNAIEYIGQTGANEALTGQGGQGQSGKAVEKRQAGGLIELGDMLDALRSLDYRAFCLIWYIMREYWTDPQWIRVTDDPNAPKYLHINMPQVMSMQGQPITYDPHSKQPLTEEDGSPSPQNTLAMMDVDIVIDPQPHASIGDDDGDILVAILDLLKMAPNIPTPLLELVIELHPRIPPSKKKRLMEALKKVEQMKAQQAQSPEVQQAKQLELADKAADIDKTKAETAATLQRTQSDREKAQLDALISGMQFGTRGAL